MALTFANVTTGTSNASGASMTSGSATVAKNVWIIVAVAADNAGTNGVSSITSVTDSAGNYYRELSETNRTAGNVANDGTTLGIYLAKVTNALSAGTITVNFSPNTIASAMSVKSITPGAGEKVSVLTIGSGVTGSAATFSAGAISVPNGYTIYGATAIEQSTPAVADSDTTNGSWSTAHTASGDTGSNSGSQSISTQQKTVTATGNQTYDLTNGGTIRDYAINAVVLWAEPVPKTWSINGVTYK